MKQYLTLPLALSVALSAFPVQADITRGCKARWEVHNGTSMRTFGQFEARGACKNGAKANDCRRAARKYAQTCMWSHWGSRWDASINSGQKMPAHCLGRGSTGVRNYGLRNLKRAIEQNACAMGKPTPHNVVVIGRTYDGKRCDGEVVVTTGYTITDKMCGKQ